MIKKLFSFIFGQGPDIFDNEGRVVHKLPQDKWQAWEDNYKDKKYDWKQHTGQKRPKK